jgi:hypothetical protein
VSLPGSSTRSASEGYCRSCVAAVGRDRRRRRRSPRAAVGGLSVFWATADDRRLADSYQAVLSQGQGAYFLAAPLQGSQGRLGTLFGYQGRPSWAMVAMEPSTRTDGRFQVQVVTRDGRYLPVGDAVIGGAERTWGAELPVDLSVVQELRFTGSDERIAFTATFDTASPWD